MARENEIMNIAYNAIVPALMEIQQCIRLGLHVMQPLLAVLLVFV